jgi:carbon-monoxide dehydrogenase medium subunit
MDVENFFRGPGKNALSKDELLTSIVIPKIKGNAASFFIKVGRTSLDLATVSIATQAYFKKNMVEDIRVVLGAVAPTPLRLRDCENHIKGHRLEPKIISEAAEIVSKNIHPITDVRGSLEYRRSTARGLTLAALESISKEIRRSTD